MALFFLSLQILDDFRKARRLFIAIFASGVLVAIFGLLQIYFQIEWVRQAIPPASTFGNKNMAAQFMVLCLPAGVCLFLSAKRRGAIWLSAFGTTFLAAFLFQTFTRAAWLAVGAEFFLGVAYIVFMRWRSPVKGALSLRHGLALLVSALLFVGLANLTPRGWEWKIGEAAERITKLLPSQRMGDEEPLSTSLRDRPALSEGGPQIFPR